MSDRIVPSARRLAAFPVHAYCWTLKPVLGLDCRFVPSCSDYALEAIASHGALGGAWLASRRVLRCHPWCAGGFDPVPEARAPRSHSPDC